MNLQICIPTIKSSADLKLLLIEIGKQYETLKLSKSIFNQVCLLIVQNNHDFKGETFTDLSIPLPSRVILEPKRGFASVRNRILMESKNFDWVLMMDDDLSLNECLFLELAKIFEDFDDLHFIAGRVTQLYQNEILSLLVPESNLDWERKRLHKLDFGSGLIALNMSFITEFGLKFDNTYDKSGGEDLDFNFRMRKKRANIYVSSRISALEIKQNFDLQDFLKREFLRAKGSVFVRLNHGKYIRQLIQVGYHAAVLPCSMILWFFSPLAQKKVGFLKLCLKPSIVLFGEICGAIYHLQKKCFKNL